MLSTGRIRAYAYQVIRVLGEEMVLTYSEIALPFGQIQWNRLCLEFSVALWS